MSKKVIAAFLVLANLMTLASCSSASGSAEETTRRSRRETEEAEEEEEKRNDDNHSAAQDRIYKSIDKIATTLAECDYDGFCELCTYTPYEIRSVMPVIIESEDNDIYDDYMKKNPGEMLLVKNAIAATTTYEIDDKSFKANLWAEKCSVDVTFSYKDFSGILDKREKFLGAADFNTLMAEVEDTVDLDITLEFEKQEDGHYLLANGIDLVQVYEYDLPQLEFMSSVFDTIEDSYMTGAGWDAATESYTDTNTFEMVIQLDENASDYIWQYRYRIADETSPDWTVYYTSEKIVDRYPTEIHLTFSQEENFTTGYYIFFIYDMQTGNIYGWEFDVFNTAEMANTSNAVTGSVTETDVPEETEEPEDET